MAPARRQRQRQRERTRERCPHFFPPGAAAAALTPRLGASMSGGIGSGPCERTSNPVSLNGGVELAVEPPERVAHLRRPLVVDAEVERLLPAVLERVEAPLFHRHRELFDLRLVVGLLVLGLDLGRRRRVAERPAERLVHVPDLVERRRRPLGHAHRHAVEEHLGGALQELGLLLEERAFSCFTSPAIVICSNFARTRSPSMYRAWAARRTCPRRRSARAPGACRG